MRDPGKVPVGEPRDLVVTRRGRKRELHQHLAQPDERARAESPPCDAPESEILPRGSCRDRMACGRQLIDHIRGPEAYGLERSAVVLAVALAIPLEASGGDHRTFDAKFGVGAEGFEPSCR